MSAMKTLTRLSNALFSVLCITYMSTFLTCENIVTKVMSCMSFLLICSYWYYARRLSKHAQYLEHTAKHDSLTGLLNRASFMEKLDALLESKHPSLAVLLLDLNKFKLVNDTLGHLVGDELLKDVAKRLSIMLRANDYVARLGGDEFVFVLISFGDVHNLELIVSRLLRAFEQPFSADSKAVEIGASIGIAIYPNDGRTTTDLLKHADVAMYTAKNEKLGYSLYEPAVDSSSLDSMELMHKLRVAVSSGNIKVYYQPKKSLVTGKITGTEALARWFDRSFGEIDPPTFVAAAEQMGIIQDLTKTVLSEAIQTFSEVSCLDNISINISPYSLGKGDLLTYLVTELGKFNVSVSKLILEVTETFMSKGTDAFIKNLACFSVLGLSLSIDDFGTGQSSMVYLRSLPIKEIKIDKSFISTMLSNVQSYSIVKSIIDLAHSVGCVACAEGVEAKEEEDALRSLGCDMIQGFYVSRPMSKADFIKFLESNHA